MKKTIDVDGLLDEFSIEISRAADTIRELVPKIEPGKSKYTKTERLGDIRSTLDDEVFKAHFHKIIEKYNLLRICEETYRAFHGKYEEESLARYEYFVILDSIDGTVNLLKGLTSGINIAVGRINSRKKLLIGDIQGVIVADYKTLSMHRWSTTNGYELIPAREQKNDFPRNQHIPTLFYEVPDERSYILNNEYKLGEKQYRLLEIFREIFPEDQRRAIDCTGLRSLAMIDNDLVAYGDVRGATYWWDTIPSIRILLECDDLVVLDGNLDEYSVHTVFADSESGRVRLLREVGDSVIIIRRADFPKLEGYKEKLLQDGGIPVQKSTENIPAISKEDLIKKIFKVDIGALIMNWGEMELEEISKLGKNIEYLNDRGNNEVAKGLQKLSNEILKDTKINIDQQKELLASINLISEQATKHPHDRMNPHSIKLILNGVAASLSAGGGAAEIWSEWGDTIISFFT